MEPTLRQIELPGYTVVVPNQVYQQNTQLSADFLAQMPGVSGAARRILTLDRTRVPTREEAFNHLIATAQSLFLGAENVASAMALAPRTVQALQALSPQVVMAIAEQDPADLKHLQDDHYHGSDLTEGQSYLYISGALFPAEAIKDIETAIQKYLRDAAQELHLDGVSVPTVADLYAKMLKKGVDYTQVVVRLQEGGYFMPTAELENLLVREVRDSFDLSVECKRTRSSYADIAAVYAKPISLTLATSEAVALVRDTATSLRDSVAAGIVQEASGCLTRRYTPQRSRGRGNRTAAMLAQLFGGNLPERVQIMGIGPEGEIVNLKGNILGENLGEGNELDNDCVGVVDEGESFAGEDLYEDEPRLGEDLEDFPFDNDDLSFGAGDPDSWNVPGGKPQAPDAQKPEAPDAQKPRGRKPSRRRRR